MDYWEALLILTIKVYTIVLNDIAMCQLYYHINIWKVVAHGSYTLYLVDSYSYTFLIAIFIPAE